MMKIHRIILTTLIKAVSKRIFHLFRQAMHLKVTADMLIVMHNRLFANDLLKQVKTVLSISNIQNQTGEFFLVMPLFQESFMVAGMPVSAVTLKQLSLSMVCQMIQNLWACNTYIKLEGIPSSFYFLRRKNGKKTK